MLFRSLFAFARGATAGDTAGAEQTHLTFLAEEPEQVGVIPASIALLAFDAAPLGGLAPQEV